MSEILRRRTFAIISHPDAGKTTLTEKLLLFGGAIQLAGAVKARGDQRRAHSDWMKVERERGISVTASVMTFEYENCIFNLLDTPGHQDFSEDTYRTLTAVDSAVMVIDAAKGIEERTLKLFEVCRLRDVPIITFVNKMDRESRDPIDILDEIESKLALSVTPATWPIGMGQHFKGCYDIMNDSLVLMEKSRSTKGDIVDVCTGTDDPKIARRVGEIPAAEMREQVELVRASCPPFEHKSYLEGHLSPVFFGSAVNNFGVKELLDGLAKFAPTPRPQPTLERAISPEEPKVSGFVFKIQANMDPKHRDRVAFVRLASGHFKRGMKLLHVRSGKTLAIANPLIFLGQGRNIADDAWPGDILGFPNHGNLRIGDGLTEGEQLHFTGIPSFAPELLQRARADDPMKAKHLGRALEQLAEEGAAQVFRNVIDSQWIVGVVGALQFEVLADRIRTEYDIPVHFEDTGLYTAQWVQTDNAADLKKFVDGNQSSLATDHDGSFVFLARNAWQIGRAKEDWPKIKFLKTREQVA
ncbi:MAG TPA: peptide chain release factor 3 [Rhodospirillaceae bacterium]|nr:MAG: peptide chain release factor 3 [Alphaproteobacteria bacterium GWF2_58_20]HAU29158.1 peptide chain release factor 3 [Rhodospirillaceae bacterium]